MFLKPDQTGRFNRLDRESEQYNDTGFIPLMTDELKTAECMESISYGGFHDITKRECFRNPHSSDEWLQDFPRFCPC